MESEPVTWRCTDFETAIVLHLGLASFAPQRAELRAAPHTDRDRKEPRNADFKSAVSRISNPPALRVRRPCRLAAVAPKRRYGAPRRRKVGDTAGWKPALLPPEVTLKITKIETIPIAVPLKADVAIRSGRGGAHTASPFLLVKIYTDEG